MSEPLESGGASRHAAERTAMASAPHAPALPPPYRRGGSGEPRAGESFDRGPRPDDAPPRRRSPGPGRGFLEADQNRDGVLTRDEAYRIPTLARHFDELDANGDGRITPSELERLRHALRQPPQAFPR